MVSLGVRQVCVGRSSALPPSRPVRHGHGSVGGGGSRKHARARTWMVEVEWHGGGSQSSSSKDRRDRVWYAFLVHLQMV